MPEQPKSAILQSMREIEAARDDARKPSFLTQLFAGEPDFSVLIPFPAQDPEDRRIGDAVIARTAAFLREKVDPAEIEQTSAIPRSILDDLSELGLLGMPI